MRLVKEILFMDTMQYKIDVTLIKQLVKVFTGSKVIHGPRAVEGKVRTVPLPWLLT